MNEITEILRLLRWIKASGKKVKLFNEYKGVPISFEATIMGVSEDSVLLQINKYQTVCIFQSRQTFIRHEVLPQVVKGAVNTLDAIKDLAVVTELAYCGTMIGDRAQVRVVPEEPVIAMILNKIQAPGILTDLSLHGAGIVLDQASYSARSFGAGQQIQLDFILPGSERTRISMNSMVKSAVLNERNKKVRIGLQTFPDTNMELTLSRYIAKRQAVILREIKSLCQPEGSDDNVTHT